MNAENYLALIPPGFIATGIVIYAVYRIRKLRYMHACGVTVNAMVVNVEMRLEGEDQTTFYYPVIQYTTAEGLVYTRTLNFIGSRDVNKYPYGCGIQVVYDPKSPEDLVLKGDELNSILSWVVLGLIFIVALVAFIWVVTALVKGWSMETARHGRSRYNY